jgi:hypothetical protein
MVSFSLLIFAQDGQDIQRYSYHVCGNVLDEKSQPMPNVTVWFMPAVRPINGRIPHTYTDNDGHFKMAVKEVPDKYEICASTTDSPFITLNDKDPSHRVTCSGPIEFGARDDSRKVEIQFKSNK